LALTTKERLDIAVAALRKIADAPPVYQFLDGKFCYRSKDTINVAVNALNKIKKT